MIDVRVVTLNALYDPYHVIKGYIDLTHFMSRPVAYCDAAGQGLMTLALCMLSVTWKIEEQGLKELS